MFQDFLWVNRLEGYGLTDLPDFKSEFSSGMDLCANFLNTEKKNLYSYEIDKISKCIIENRKDPIYPAMNRYDTEQNITILDRWIQS